MRPSLALLAVPLVVAAGCGSAHGSSVTVPSSTPTTSTAVPGSATTVACGSGDARLAPGDRIVLRDCPAGLDAHVTGTAVRQESPTTYVAVAPGTASVELAVRPVCGAGQACPQYVRVLGTLQVTVA